MKKLSKLKLKEFAVMSDREMKSVVGGYEDEYSAKCDQPWHKACDGQAIGVRCTFKDGGEYKVGYCSQNAFNACKYCFQGPRGHY